MEVYDSILSRLVSGIYLQEGERIALYEEIHRNRAEVKCLQAENARLKGADKPADESTPRKQWEVTHKWGSE